MGRPHRDVGLQLLENKALSRGIIRMSACILADITIRKSQKLTHPMQVRVLDALAEAGGVPHQRGQTEIEIPEKLRNYNQYLMSPEYQAQLTEAQAKRRK
jgi:hypothetical protein